MGRHGRPLSSPTSNRLTLLQLKRLLFFTALDSQASFPCKNTVLVSSIKISIDGILYPKKSNVNPFRDNVLGIRTLEGPSKQKNKVSLISSVFGFVCLQRQRLNLFNQGHNRQQFNSRSFFCGWSKKVRFFSAGTGIYKSIFSRDVWRGFMTFFQTQFYPRNTNLIIFFQVSVASHSLV